ncbi:PepSY-associated TM helix domain-containing protein [Nafulsella turpanensis]|uniref:PepSY-associated TM helix domain-containing protein n=1 Tax=Nafulsella turpanensis TaxID=1265690 RepID=UPI0003481F00|nr:PepSY-associated TM helix domain-containing protein [Nafulsella turpanensis]
MSNRVHNILFHTHTISGILISVGLFVIFFAGSFSFFRDEIISWERNEPMQESSFSEVDLNGMMEVLEQDYDTYSRDITFEQYYEEKRISVTLSAPKDTSIHSPKGGAGGFFYMNTDNFRAYDYASNYSIGEFLYRLHFFAQLNLYGRSGYFIAGLVAFFFLFAIITGVLVHWKKIISNFYVFRPRASLKNIWTDAHTALGIIGLPFQFMYAVSGAYLIIGAAIMSPPVLSLMYNGDSDKMYEDLSLGVREFPLAMKKAEPVDLNHFVENTNERWPALQVQSVTLHNYGDANMHITVMGLPEFSEKFSGVGELVFKATSGEVISVKDPFTDVVYLDAATGIIDRLHFGDFGGVGLKVVYFILGLISCFVIISGILIWLVARDKKHIAEKKRKFNAWVGWIFLAACLSMYPVTAFTFVAVKLFVQEFDTSRMTAIYQIFFYSWLLLIVLFTFRKDNFITNKFSLLLGSVLGLLVPITNGFVSGNWIWRTFSEGYFDIFLVDAFWLTLSVATFFIAIRLRRNGPLRLEKKERNDSPTRAVASRQVV